jgi:hypothetical protein
MSSVIPDDYDEVLDQVKGILGEHFANYAFVVLDDDGTLYYDYANFRVGRMLFSEASADMLSGVDLDISWEEPTQIPEEPEEE